MKKNFCTVVFDRKKTLSKKGEGKVEIQIRLTRLVRKYITINKCYSLQEWKRYAKSKELHKQVLRYEGIVSAMETLGEPMTLETLNGHIGIKKDVATKSSVQPARGSFIEFMLDCINKEDIDHDTKRQRLVALRDVEEFGKLKTFADLTPSNIQEYDFYVRAKRKPNGEPFASATIDNYHKRLHHYVMLAYQKEIIDRDPYLSVKIKRGRNKERKPLLENELVVLRYANIKDRYLDRVRDLFVFAAYTGLAYVDVMGFDFETMTEAPSHPCPPRLAYRPQQSSLPDIPASRTVPRRPVRLSVASRTFAAAVIIEESSFAIMYQN